MSSVLPHRTSTVCPVCLQTVSAVLTGPPDAVMLEGDCPDHGSWSTPVWKGPPSFDSWCAGADTNAARQVCTVLLEVTERCNLGCPICFAEAGQNGGPSDPSVGSLARRLRALFESEGAINLQISGGEPTVRDDLVDIARSARETGFTFIQLNTNGLRLASEAGYAERLHDAGLASVFLQFDGVSDAVHETLRGRPLADVKMRAIERCAAAGLAVVLVPTLVAGVNDGEVGDLLRFAASWPGVVRGLHFQPISYFGRYPDAERPRLTLPEVLRLLEAQSGGNLRPSDFAPSCCEHVRCSFRARYWVREGGRLELLRSGSSCCASSREEPAERAVAATARQWALSPPGGDHRSPKEDGLSRFLEEAGKILTVSGMVFQDAWNLDWERVDRCCVRVATPTQGLASFCLWNLTSASGQRLHSR